MGAVAACDGADGPLSGRSSIAIRNAMPKDKHQGAGKKYETERIGEFRRRSRARQHFNRHSGDPAKTAENDRTEHRDDQRREQRTEKIGGAGGNAHLRTRNCVLHADG